MRERVDALLGEPTPRLLGTFHAVCARMLRIEARATASRRGFVIYDDADQMTLMSAPAESAWTTALPAARRARRAITQAKNRLEAPRLRRSARHRDEEIVRAYERYQSALADAAPSTSTTCS